MDEEHDARMEAIQHLNMARSMFEEGRYPEMGASAEKSLMLDDSLGPAWELLGLARLHEMDLVKARLGFEKALDREDRAEDARIALKVMSERSWPKGHGTLDAVNGLVALGQVYLSSGRFRSAALCLTSIEPFVEPNCTIGSMMGLIYRELGMLEVSLAYYEKASSMEGAPPELLHDRSIVLIKLGRLEEAEGLLGKLLEEIDDDPRIWNNYGTVLEALGRDGDALEAYDRALLIDSDYHPALYSKGRVLQKQGRMEDARPVLERALDIEGEVYTIDDLSAPGEHPANGVVRMKEISTVRGNRKDH
ncbi:MAG: tetratricopeptide repeat protein [Candidatus Thermoplasmatota archaeon]|nr:tetratricopeptide repeat protein [Candidatus Thermoplasmatota archaeon]